MPHDIIHDRGPCPADAVRPLLDRREGEFLNAQQRARLAAESERQIRTRLEGLDQTHEAQALV